MVGGEKKLTPPPPNLGVFHPPSRELISSVSGCFILLSEGLDLGYTETTGGYGIEKPLDKTQAPWYGRK